MTAPVASEPAERLDTPVARAVDLARVVADGTVDQVEVAWPDQFGHVLGKRIPARGFLDRARGPGFAFCDAALGWNSTGEVIDAVRLTNAGTGYPDAYAVPDLGTARLLPWRARSVHVIADVVDHHRHAVRTSPRAVLQRVVERLAALGMRARVGVELEFYLLDRDGGLLQEELQAYSLEKNNALDPALQEIIDAVTGFVPFEGAHTEYAPSQVEINLHHADPVTAADDAFRLRYAVREAASRAGRLASFMAKPFTDLSGSSGHLHVSLWRGDEPLFAPDHDGEGALTRHAIAGLLRHLPAIAVFGSPTVNAYKRYAVSSFAPTSVSWGGDNRTGAVRSLLETPDASRIELRTPSADANPYWSIAALLAAVVAGLESPTPLSARGSGDLYSREADLPATLRDAIDLARADEDIIEILGDDAVHDYTTLVETDWTAFMREVTTWERDRYLRRR